jgi:hypothetical protein
LIVGDEDVGGDIFEDGDEGPNRPWGLFGLTAVQYSLSYI